MNIDHSFVLCIKLRKNNFKKHHTIQVMKNNFGCIVFSYLNQIMFDFQHFPSKILKYDFLKIHSYISI